jgi:putative transposase
MPRIARVVAIDYPHHITQRGNNRAATFFDDEDRQTYLRLLALYAQKHRLQIWAYCLMNNHVHLLAVPETETSLSRGIGLTNQVYTQYLNRKLKQSGRIWQNRFFSCVVDSDRYLWAVARYIERNPLKADLAVSAETYRWSSALAHMTGSDDSLLHEPGWLSVQDRKEYGTFVRANDEATNDAIRLATKTGRPFGSGAFVDMLESRLNQSLKARRRGRPRKENGECP